MSDPSENVRDDIFADGDENDDQSGSGSSRGEVSEGGSSFDTPSSAEGGADAVPDTPDGVPEDNIDDAARGDYSRTGRDVQTDDESDTTERAGSDVSPDAG